MPRILSIIATFCLLAVSFNVLCEPVQFRAEYEAEYRGLPVKARGIRELVHVEGNRYRMVSSASSFLANVVETSEFEIRDDALTPLNYEYERKGLGKNKQEAASFDWQSGLSTHDGEASALEAGTLDKLSYQYQLRTDVASALAENRIGEVLTYNIADMEKRKTYAFEIAGMEQMSTPIGPINAVRINRLRDDDKKRETSLWLAVDHAYLLVRLRQTEEDKGFELNLSSAVIDGQELTLE